jgi:hypothetical protein
MKNNHIRQILYFIFIVIVIFGLTGPMATPVLAADTGWLNPAANAADTGGDGNGFETNPTGAYANGGTYASNINGAGDRHRYYNYNINIPSGNVITGIEVRLDWWLDRTNGTNSMSVELSWNGGVNWTSPKQATTERTSDGNPTDILGSSSDTWGHTWTTNELTNANFRVRLTCNSTSGSRDFYLDWVPVRVYYCTPPNCTITAPSSVCANSTGNTASVPDAGGGATYVWTITNGTITAGQGTRSITWSAGTVSPVTIGITVTAADGCQCTNSTQVTVISPDCSITVPSSVCANSTGNTASVPNAGVGATYTWTITNGTITAGQGTRSITWSAGPTGPVTIGITINVSGCQCTNSTQVTVIVLSCAITAPSSVYANSTGNNASVPEAGGGATYAWTITNGTITAGQGTRSITWRAYSTSPITIGITVNVGGCQCTNSMQVTVTTPPSLSVDISGNLSFCEGGSTILTANAAGGVPPYTYDWSASTAPGSYVDNEYTATGAGTVAVTVSDSSLCSNTIVSDTDTMVTRGNGSTPHNAVLAWVHPNWWPGLDYNFGYPSNTAQWIWETYEVVHPEEGDVVYFERSFDIPSTPFNAILRVTCDNGYEAYMNGTFLGWAQLADYNGIPWEDSDLTDNWVYGNGWQSVETYYPTLQKGTNTLELRTANEQVTGGTVTSNPGGVIYELTYEYYCAASDSVDITVNPVPIASASSNSPVEEGDTIMLTGGPDGMSSYSWTGPNGFSSFEQSPSIPNATVAMSGNYVLTITNSYGCQDDASVNVTVNPASIPTVTAIEIFEDSACTIVANSMTPQSTYYARVSVNLSTTLDHLQTVMVTLFYDAAGSNPIAPTSGDTHTCAILSCTVGLTPVWTISSGAPTSWTIETAECVQPPLNATSGNWIFAFKPGKVATESIAPANWDTQGKAIRTPLQTGELYVRDKAMNWYGEIIVPASVDWGEVPLGLTFEDATYNPETAIITYIANGDYYEDIRSSGSWTGSGETVALDVTGGNPPPAGMFALMADNTANLGDALVVTTEYKHINASGSLTTEDGVTVNTNSLWLSLGETDIAPVTYSGTIYCQIANR